MVERRRSVRQKSFLAGCIYFNDRRRSAECLIREISDQGARIVFSRAVNIPDLSSSTFHSESRPCARACLGAKAMQ
jgi:hypothetical protein